MAEQHEWENIEPWTQKMRVPGGWLYLHRFELHISNGQYLMSESMCFVPEAVYTTVRIRPEKDDDFHYVQCESCSKRISDDDALNAGWALDPEDAIWLCRNCRPVVSGPPHDAATATGMYDRDEG